MRNAKPPRIATWLLRRFEGDKKAEAIAGDLLEHFQEGRSYWWYWREVLVAIAKPATWGFWVFIRVLIVGWLVLLNVAPRLLPYLAPSIKPVPVIVSMLVFGVLTGGVLALLNRPYHLPPIIFFTATLLIRDLFKLLIWPGVQMTPPHQPGPMYFMTWLLYTTVDLAFVGGAITSAVLVALFFPRSAFSSRNSFRNRS